MPDWTCGTPLYIGQVSSMSIEPTDKAYAGQAIYNPATLALYDIVVLGISNRLIWRCPTRHILQLYNQHATDNHLDVGVGTGWYLDHCRSSGPRVRLGLLDLNRSSLNTAAARLRRYRPEVYQADALRPFRFETAAVCLSEPHVSSALSSWDHERKSSRI